MTSHTPKNPLASEDAGKTALNPRTPFDMVALDIDGTLLRADKRLSMKVVNAVKCVRSMGVRVILATARPPRSVKEIHGILGLDTLVINYNGALIYNFVTKKTMMHWNMEPELALEIIKFARKLFPKVVVNVENLDRGYTDRVDDKLKTETSKTFAPDGIGPIESFLTGPVTKVMFMADESLMEDIRREIDAKYGKKVSFPASDPHLLQMMNKDADKAIALKWVADYYKVRSDRVIAMGDAPNDVGMLKWAGLGVAMGNGWIEAKDAADIVVPPNDEDGVAYALKRYIIDHYVPRPGSTSSTKLEESNEGSKTGTPIQQAVGSVPPPRSAPEIRLSDSGTKPTK
jgi:Cof subfamily protein (haloacid dehalogenase superfamily)